MRREKKKERIGENNKKLPVMSLTPPLDKTKYKK